MCSKRLTEGQAGLKLCRVTNSAFVRLSVALHNGSEPESHLLPPYTTLQAQLAAPEGSCCKKRGLVVTLLHCLTVGTATNLVLVVRWSQ
jgi:hypothetical protein